ncbi:DNA/RNA helicase domain-containing protein [Achromobacter sp. HNDS-1]|uniref:DNA/RNA helicase domain-containing protein n=1 Tax=Achromobacter sp. HNDS-1 TaxID=3151598 RepID=A0AAU7LH90_9BURK
MTALAIFSVEEFCHQALDPDLPDRLARRFVETFDRNGVSAQEKASWAKSLPALANLLRTLPMDGHILIEYPMPLGNRRADCVLIGMDAAAQTHIVIIELKQWSQGSIRLNHEFDMGWLTVNASEPYSTDHPCEQADIYRVALGQLLDLGEESPQIHALAYLHEYAEIDNDLLRESRFRDHLNRAHLMTRNHGRTGALALLANLQRKSPILERLISPRLRYSDTFIANFSNKLNCSALFEPSTGQTETFKEIASALNEITTPTCVIVKGIVGTGKTVLAMLLVRYLMERGKNPKYYVRSAAIKDCMEHLDFYSEGRAATEYLVVDEAHRLSEGDLPKLLRNRQLTIFFVDDNQWLHPDENCRSHHILDAALDAGMCVTERTLTEQLRCRDANAYLAWVDDFMNHGKLAPLKADEDFEVTLVDSPDTMQRLLAAQAKDGSTCRIVAGYCWPWKTAKTPGRNYDIDINGWQARWNAPRSYAEWNRAPGLHEEVGAIYTVQGFEYDYVGVLIGDDLIHTEKGLRIQASAQQYAPLTSTRTRGNIPQEQRDSNFSRAIRNIYYVLMTRAKKGVLIYAVHAGLQDKLAQMLDKSTTGTFPKPAAGRT